MLFLSVTYYYCWNVLLLPSLVIICIYFYFPVLFWYASVNFNTYTISITVFFGWHSILSALLSIMFPLCTATVYYIRPSPHNPFWRWLLPYQSIVITAASWNSIAMPYWMLKAHAFSAMLTAWNAFSPLPHILFSKVRCLIMVLGHSKRIASSVL